VKCVKFFFQAIGFLELIRAEMIFQAVWAWRPGRLRSVNIPVFSWPLVTSGCFEHRKHIIQHADVGIYQNLSA